MRVNLRAKEKIKFGGARWFGDSEYSDFVAKLSSFEAGHFEQRHRLYLKAKTGDEKAAKELWEKYHARAMSFV
jgi:hypothetical protein